MYPIYKTPPCYRHFRLHTPAYFVTNCINESKNKQATYGSITMKQKLRAAVSQNQQTKKDCIRKQHQDQMENCRSRVRKNTNTWNHQTPTKHVNHNQ